MVTATAGVNGRMAKDKKADKAGDKAGDKIKMPEGRAKRGSAGAAVKAMPAFLEENSTLRHTLAQIEKQFGEGSIMPLGIDRQAPIEGI